MRFVTIVLVLAGWACGDPSLQLRFEVPETYRDDVVAVTLRILVPPDAEQFTCNQLAFQEVSDETLRLSTVQTVVARDELELGLSGIPRQGAKVFHLQGVNSDDLPVVAGCIEVGLIEGDMTVGVVGEPTTLVNTGNNDPGSPLPLNHGVAVKDTNDVALASAEVRWRVVGPRGDTTTGIATTNGEGIAIITPQMPALAGPVIMDIRARWTQVPPQPVPGFKSPLVVAAVPLPFAPMTQLATDTIYQVGRIGPNGEIGVVGLSVGESALTERRAIVGYYDTVARDFVSATTALIPEAVALGMVTRDGRDRVFTITANGWIEIEANGALATLASPVPGKIAQKIVSTSCGPDIERVLVQFTDNSFATLTADRLAVDGPFDDENGMTRINAAGCVSGVAGGEYPVVAFARVGLMPGPLELVADMDVVRRGTVGIARNGVGFAPAMGSAPAYLLASQFAVDGASLVRYQLATLNNQGVALTEITDDQTATASSATRAGDLDGDGISDVIALVTFGDNGEGKTQYRLFVALGAEHKGERIVGMSGLAEAVRPHIWVADFDGDGIDDLLVGSPTGFAVLRMGEID